MESITKAHLLKKELDTFRPLTADQEQMIMQKFRLDWNFHSNHLEGNSLTYGETKALLLHHITAQGKPLKDHFEITGHNEAILWVEDVIKNERPLTEQFIRELHKLLLKEPYQVDAITPDGAPTKKWINVGQYKITPNHVKTKTGEIFRFAMPEETPAKMHDLMAWYQAESQRPDVDPIILAANFHYRFVRIHPFDDGNGRVARILMNFILMSFGYPPVIIKVEEKDQYFSALQQADAEIFEPFVDFIAKNLLRSLEIMLRGVRGESIEELDDIDKEISLLDLKFRSFGSKIEKIKSEEAIKDFINDSLRPFILSFSEVVHTFKKYFINHLSEIVTKGGNWREKELNFWSSAEYILLQNLGSISDSISFKSTLSEMSYIGFEKEALEISFRVNFNRSTVSVETFNFQREFLYTETPSEEDYLAFKRALKIRGKQVLESILKSKGEDEGN